MIQWSKAPPTADEVRARIESHGEAVAMWRGAPDVSGEDFVWEVLHLTVERFPHDSTKPIRASAPGTSSPYTDSWNAHDLGGEWGGWCATPDEVAAREQALEWALAKVRERDDEIARLQVALKDARNKQAIDAAQCDRVSSEAGAMAVEMKRLGERVATMDQIVAAARDLVSMMRVKCNQPGCKACVLWDAIRTLDAKKDA